MHLDLIVIEWPRPAICPEIAAKFKENMVNPEKKGFRSVNCFPSNFTTILENIAGKNTYYYATNKDIIIFKSTTHFY